MAAVNLFWAFFAGFACGFVVSIPVGPVNLTVINTALQRGFAGGLLVGLGAVTADSFYATIMLAGHSTILEHTLDKSAVRLALQSAAAVVLVVLAWRALRFRPEALADTEAAAARAEERWHHPRAFVLGFLLTVANLMLVVLWATVTAALFAHGWVQPAWLSRLACTAGVFSGGALWFALLAYSVAHAHRRVAPRTITRLVRACGVVFLFLAALLVIRLLR